MRLIDADALKEVMISTLEHIKQHPKMDGQERHIIAASAALSEMINDAPTVDAVPVRHGRWETDGIMMDECEFLMTRCTACGETYEYGFNMPFCPNCGADMRKDGGDEQT